MGLWLAAVAFGTAQPRGATLRGRLTDSLNAQPVANALVFIEELARETRSGADGAYSFDNLPPGTYHLLIQADKFIPGHFEVTLAAAPVTQDFTLNPELHFTEVVSVSPEPRSQFESYQPTSVLQGQELTRDMRGTLAAVLDGQPGIAERSFGPAPARPVIRGMDGDRVLILEDSNRMGDLSSQSADHGVAVNPALASRLEIVRGPATLLYGSNAVGGLVNVITESIPMRRLRKPEEAFTFDAGSAAGEAGGAGNVAVGLGQFVWRAGGSGRRSGDARTPQGRVDNSHAWALTGDVALSWVGAKWYAGGSYGYDDARYGVPVLESGNVELTPRRHSTDLRLEGNKLDGFITSARASVAVRRYRHDELDAGQIGTAFRNNTSEVEAHLHHRPVGHFKGTFGAWGLVRTFEAAGAEALSPPVNQRGLAVFLYEEANLRRIAFEFSGRFDHVSYTPQGNLQSRSFDAASGAVGLILHANAVFTVAASLAHVARPPALEELYFMGPHPGNYAFEAGNPNLSAERATGIDLALRWQHKRASGELSYFRNAIRHFILRNYTGDFEEGYPVVEFVGSDGLMQGFELHADIQLNRWLYADGTMDYVWGEIRNLNTPMPRIPPFRFRGGLRYQQNALQIGGVVTAAAKQERVFGFEQPTAGYGLLRFYAAYSFLRGRAATTIRASLDNATNELYRNHRSYMKQSVPEVGGASRWSTR